MTFNLMDIFKQKHGSHIDTFKKDKINNSFKTICLLFFWEKICVEKIFILENCLDVKIVCIEKLLALEEN